MAKCRLRVTRAAAKGAKDMNSENEYSRRGSSIVVSVRGCSGGEGNGVRVCDDPTAGRSALTVDGAV